MPTRRKGLEICLKNTTTGLFWFSQMVTMSVCYPTIFQDSGHIILYLVWASSSTEFCSHQNSVKGLVTNVAQREQSYFWPKNGRKHKQVVGVLQVFCHPDEGVKLYNLLEYNRLYIYRKQKIWCTYLFLLLI